MADAELSDTLTSTSFPLVLIMKTWKTNKLLNIRMYIVTIPFFFIFGVFDFVFCSLVGYIYVNFLLEIILRSVRSGREFQTRTD